MKKRARSTQDIGGTILAVLSEDSLTTPEIAKKIGRKFQNVSSALNTLKKRGKVRQDGRGKPWRLHGPAVSPLRDEDDPGPAAAEGQAPPRR